MWTEEEMATKMNKIHNMDCLEFMKQVPDNYFDLVLTDPPYGIGESGGSYRGRNTNGKRSNHRVHDRKDWDTTTPSKEYFDEIFRISKNQIIWGGNYFTDKGLYPTKGWIYWDKKMGGDFADGELAWTSFDRALRSYSKCNKMSGKVHPTQKADDIIRFSLEFARLESPTVFDPFMGSGTTALIAKENDLNWCGCELDKDYYLLANKRLSKVQTSMFAFMDEVTA